MGMHGDKHRWASVRTLVCLVHSLSWEGNVFFFFFNSSRMKIHEVGPENAAQWLESLFSMPKVRGSVLSTHRDSSKMEGNMVQ